MLTKILAVASLVTLPFNVALWYKSHASPEQYRTDVTVYKSLRVYLQDGICGLHVLSMPNKCLVRSESRGPLTYSAMPDGALLLSSSRSGPYRMTWLVFPLWLSTSLMTFLCCLPVARGPVLKSWRRWRGACETCGYDLRGNRSGRCPECGTRLR
jgi:hypothetical protein